jgi:hypothetical protein
MAAAVVLPEMPTSFVYEDLISKVQTIQSQMAIINIVLSNRWKNEKRKRDEIKSRSFVFIDPYGNRTVNKYMDQELISKVSMTYKKDYVPKYLQRWIKIGTIKENVITPLNDCELKSNVSYYANGYQFVTYGEITVWIGTNDSTALQKIVLRVLLTDTLEKIKAGIKKFRQFTNIELKSYVTNSNTQPNEENWNEGIILKSEDTILSGQLFQDHCVILAKVSNEQVNYHLLLFVLCHQIILLLFLRIKR